MKKFLKLLGDELLYGSHLVALGAFGITLSVILTLGLPIKPLLLAIAYLVYLIIYTYNHARELIFDKQSNPERVKHLSGKQKWVKASPFVYFGLLCISLFFSNVPTALLTLFILAGGILYTEYFKKVPVLGWKTYYVSFFWAILILLIPLFYKFDNLTPYLYFVIFIFLRGLVNTTFSDIKDIETDSKRKIKTFPVFWGKERALYILQFVNLISFAPIIIGIYTKDLPIISFLFALTILNGIYYLTRAMKMSEKQLRLFSSILIDGEYIFWPLVIFIGKFFI